MVSKVSSVAHAFENVWERPIAKNYHPVSLLSVVSKVVLKFVNDRIVGRLEKSILVLICMVLQFL